MKAISTRIKNSNEKIVKTTFIAENEKEQYILGVLNNFVNGEVPDRLRNLIIAEAEVLQERFENATHFDS